MNKGWLIVAKKEMTKMWIEDNFVPVTLVQIVPQEIVRYKTLEKDGYVSAVVGMEKKERNKDKGQKIVYRKMQEYKVDDSFVSSHEAWSLLNFDLLEGVAQVDVTGTAKGKGFQGMVKKFHIKWGGATHGHQKEIENQEEHLKDILMQDICELNVLPSKTFLLLIKLSKIMSHWLSSRDHCLEHIIRC